MRRASRKRVTQETSISVELNIDGTGKYESNLRQLGKNAKPSKDVPIPHTSDIQLDKLWHEHTKKLTVRGITITFKPVRFYTSKELNNLDRQWSNQWLPPTIEEVNK